MYQYSSYRTKPSKGSYFLPFVSLIILGLIVVLVFQIVDYFQERRIKALENKAAVKIVTGRAEMKIWGVDQWTSAITESILHEGDRMRTSPGSRVVLSLQNGSVVRLSSETEVEISALKTRDSQDEAEFSLQRGELWIRRSSNETVRTAFGVTTDHLDVRSAGTIFDVSAGTSESVRVLDGKVMVSVKVKEPDSGEARVADSMEVALGQEITVGSREISELQNKRPISLLALLSDEFRSSEWYSWNRSEDLTGASGVTVADAVSNRQQPKLSITEEKPEVTQVPEVSEFLSPPVILSPASSARVSKAGFFQISGTVNSAAEKVEITTYISGKPESYILKKYKPGSSRWNSTLSREYGNIIAGENRITVVAIGKDGKRSDPTEITLTYDKPKEPADLSAPTVSQQVFETTEDSVNVSGKIGKGIIKVTVNDFTLTRYVPDSLVWSYVASSKYGNLQEGENSYAVYGVDFDGNKTPVTKFTIIKKGKPAEAAPPAPASAPSPAPSPVPTNNEL